MKRLLLLALLAACGGKSATTTTTPPANGGGEPAGPPYAALFDAGRSWTFDVKFHADDGESEGNDWSTQATCSVTGVEELDGGKVSHINCAATGEEDVSGIPLQGDWFSDQTALYRGVGDEKELVMVAAPVEKTEGGESEEEGSWSKTIARKGEAWCWSSSSALGDEGWESLCFGAAGVTEGTWGWAGGSVHEQTFTLKAGS